MPTTAYGTKSAQFVESALRRVGIKVTVEELDFATWLKDVHNGGNYDMSIVAHVEARDLRRFTDPTYYFHYDNAEYNKQFEAADEAPDELVPLMRKANARRRCSGRLALRAAQPGDHQGDGHRGCRRTRPLSFDLA